jgi:hypothetical protein
MTSTAQEKGSETDLSINSTPAALHTGFTAKYSYLMSSWQLKCFLYNLTLLHVVKAFVNWRPNLQLYITEQSYSLNCHIDTLPFTPP